MGFCAVVTVTPQWLLHMGDRGTSTEQSEVTTLATSRSACSECSVVKEELVDVKRTLATQQLEMDTLCQLMESMRSHSLTAHPGAMHTNPVLTTQPIGHSPSIPRELSLPAISCLSSPALLPSPTLPHQHDDGAMLPLVPSMESSPSPPPSVLPPEGCTIIVTPAEGEATEMTEDISAPSAVVDAVSPRSASSSDDYRPPSCPPPDVTTDDPMALDSPAHPSPKIVISVSEIPESIAAESAVPLDEGGLSEGHTQLGS